MDYLKYTVREWEKDKKEIIMAYLSQIPFEAFEEEEEQISGYVPAENDVEELTNSLIQLQAQFSFKFERELLPEKNWNEVWESNFDPIRVGEFCYIRAPFHEPESDVQLNITINPKMAFGTGHHATTYMMVEFLGKDEIAGLKVLDYGCGTGILAIVAARLGASEIDAIDIDEWAVENTLENAQLNQVGQVATKQSNLENWESHDYDRILANINRNVILNSLPALYNKLNRNGRLLISGILDKDRKLVLDAAAEAELIYQTELRRGEWVAMSFTKH